VLAVLMALYCNKKKQKVPCILKPNPSENSINPWESTDYQSDSEPSGFEGDRYVTSFSGELDKLRIAKHFGSSLQIGCIIPLVMVSALIWGVILSVGIGPMGFAVVSLAALLILWFVWIRYVGKNHARRLLRRRPWLEGPLNGVASSSRLTLWHNDLCLQSKMQGYMVDTKRGMISYPDNLSTFPWAMIPSTSFYQDQWYDLLSTIRSHRKAERLIYQAAPAEAWECILAPRRSLVLKNRIKALSLQPNGGAFLVMLVLGIWLSFIPMSLDYQAPVLAVPLMFILGYILIELSRFTYARIQVMRQFAKGSLSAYRKIPVGQDPQLQWFSGQHVMFSDINHWVLCPVKYVQRVKVRGSWIEFRIGEEPVLFHREGFADESSWRGACQEALSIEQGLRKQQAI